MAPLGTLLIDKRTVVDSGGGKVDGKDSAGIALTLAGVSAAACRCRERTTLTAAQLLPRSSSPPLILMLHSFRRRWSAICWPTPEGNRFPSELARPCFSTLTESAFLWFE